MQTRWSILHKRLEEAEKEVSRLKSEISYEIQTSFHTICETCGHEMWTEADHAKHYRIDDERYLNLGWCPYNKRYGE